MQLKHKDGELRIYDRQSATTGYYIRVLFTDANLTFPLNRGKVEETLDMDRGNMNTFAKYREGPDTPITDPLPISFSMRMQDVSTSQHVRQLVSGVTIVNSKVLKTTKGNYWIRVGQSKVTPPNFADTSKYTYNVEMLWDGATDYGYRLRDVYFPPEEQRITEGETEVSVSVNGLLYGRIDQISAFSSGSAV